MAPGCWPDGCTLDFVPTIGSAPCCLCFGSLMLACWALTPAFSPETGADLFLASICSNTPLPTPTWLFFHPLGTGLPRPQGSSNLCSAIQVAPFPATKDRAYPEPLCGWWAGAESLLGPGFPRVGALLPPGGARPAGQSGRHFHKLYKPKKSFKVTFFCLTPPFSPHLSSSPAASKPADGLACAQAPCGRQVRTLWHPSSSGMGTCGERAGAFRPQRK